MQRSYREGLEGEGIISFPESGELPAGQGPTVREGVDAGTDVIDLGAMRAQLEEERRRRQGGE